MTIPSRSAPPVPGAARNTSNSHHHHHQQQQPSGSSGGGFQTNGGGGAAAASSSAMRKKPPPPRPPLPQALATSAHHHQQQQPKNIASLTSIFRRMKTNDNRPKDLFTLPPPPPKGSATRGGTHNPNYNATSNSSHSATTAAATSNALELISFDSPPTSPTPTHKSSSSWTSSLSFSSDLAATNSGGGGQPFGASNASSHLTSVSSNTNTWQTRTPSLETRSESGFEDDFSSQAAFDPFSPEIGVMPVYGSATYGSTNAGAAAKTAQTAAGHSQFGWSADFLDPLCNGKSLLAPEPQVVMPTIIRPVFKAQSATGSSGSRYGGGGGGGGSSLAATQSSSGAFRAAAQQKAPSNTWMAATTTTMGGVLQSGSHADKRVVSSVNRRRESWAIVLYQFDALQDGDLSLMPDEKVILLNQINADWFYGRNERGDEGMLPTSYVDVKQPLPADSPAKSKAPLAPQEAPTPTAPATPQAQPISSARPARALFAFAAQTADDLSLVEGGAVGVLYAINEDWWYGETTDGRRGQFPAAYVEML